MFQLAEISQALGLSFFTAREENPTHPPSTDSALNECFVAQAFTR
jgi:hypothetical protein